MDVGGIWADLRWNWKAKLKRVRLHLIAFAAFVVGILETVDPYSIMSLIPDRWQGAGYLIIGVLIWLFRKVASQPVLVSTTHHAEDYQAITDFDDSTSDVGGDGGGD